MHQNGLDLINRNNNAHHTLGPVLNHVPGLTSILIDEENMIVVHGADRLPAIFIIIIIVLVPILALIPDPDRTLMPIEIDATESAIPPHQ